ncbi:MAG: hypothetical protein HFG05_13235 [Oscillibacter sp.]|nr:hypothetical protein [Oscillibacter sp.]
MPNQPRTFQPITDWSTEISAPPSASSPASEPLAAFQFPPTPMAPDAPPAFQFPSTPPAAVSAPPTVPADSPASPPSTPAVSSHPAVSSTPVVSSAPAAPASPGLPAVRPASQHPAHNEFAGSTGNLDLRNHQPAEVIEAPTSTGEAFLGSLKAMLLRNRGNFVAATLLIGTQGTMVWEGILHEVGNDYFIIYQAGRQRYILCDIFALKYMEFYDTRQRELCEHLLQENGENGFR